MTMLSRVLLAAMLTAMAARAGAAEQPGDAQAGRRGRVGVDPSQRGQDAFRRRRRRASGS